MSLLTAAHVAAGLCRHAPEGQKYEVRAFADFHTRSDGHLLGWVIRSVPTEMVPSLKVDAALVEIAWDLELGGVVRDTEISGNVLDVTAPDAPEELEVWFRGASTGTLQSGMMKTREVKHVVQLGNDHITYHGTRVIESTSDRPISSAGDSGSIVVDKNDDLVGMIVARLEDGSALCIPIKPILEALNCTPFRPSQGAPGTVADPHEGWPDVLLTAVGRRKRHFSL